MKPCAAAASRRGPYASASLLEISTTVGGSRTAASRSATVKAVDVGKLDVEQHDVRAQPLELDERRPSVGGSSQDYEPLRLEQRAHRLPEGLVVVDDQHRRAHTPIVAKGARALWLAPVAPARSSSRHAAKTVACPVLRPARQS